MPRESRPAGSAAAGAASAGRRTATIGKKDLGSAWGSKRFKRTLDASCQTRSAGEHLACADTKNRVSPAGGHSCQRDENEPTFVKLRMGQKELSRHAIAAATADDPPAKIQNVEIERSRLPVTAAPPSRATFKAFQQAQKPGGADGPSHANNHVQISRLPAKA